MVVAAVRCPLSGSLSGGPGAAGPGTGLGPEPRMQQQPVRARRASEIKFALGLLTVHVMQKIVCTEEKEISNGLLMVCLKVRSHEESVCSIKEFTGIWFAQKMLRHIF